MANYNETVQTYFVPLIKKVDFSECENVAQIKSILSKLFTFAKRQQANKEDPDSNESLSKIKNISPAIIKNDIEIVKTESKDTKPKKSEKKAKDTGKTEKVNKSKKDKKTEESSEEHSGESSEEPSEYEIQEEKPKKRNKTKKTVDSGPEAEIKIDIDKSSESDFEQTVSDDE